MSVSFSSLFSIDDVMMTTTTTDDMYTSTLVDVKTLRRKVTASLNYGLASGDIPAVVTQRSPPRSLLPHFGLRRRALPLPSLPFLPIHSTSSYRFGS